MDFHSLWSSVAHQRLVRPCSFQLFCGVLHGDSVYMGLHKKLHWAPQGAHVEPYIELYV